MHRRPRFFCGVVLLAFSPANLFAQDLGFRFIGGKCKSRSGQVGYNPQFVGECGDLSGMDFSGQDLSGKFLRGAKLENTKLVGTKLNTTILRNAILIGTDLQQADLTSVDLEAATMR